MQIFVINLEKDLKRRESIKRQLNELQLPFEFVPGVLGSALSPAELTECYDDKKARRNLCMSLVPAHIGCSLSHTRVYQKILERNLSCALIMEDDVILPETMPGVLLEIQKKLKADRPEVILLSPAEGKHRSRARGLLGVGHEILDYQDGFFTSSYVVTNLAARALLKELYPIGDVADCWSRMHRYKVVDLFVINPPLIDQDRTTFGSSTNVDTWKVLDKRSPLDIFLFKCRRAWSKSIDCFYAFYRRKLVPYAGIDISPRTGNKK